MKRVILSFLLLTACGDEFEIGKGTLDAEKAFSPSSLSATDVQRLSVLCTSLGNKFVRLSQGFPQNITFGVAQKGCNEDTLGAESAVAVTLEPSATSYRLRRVDNNGMFVYPDLETNQTGIMKEVCANLSNATSPRKLSNGSILAFSTANLGTDNRCIPGPNEICISIEVGAPLGENSYRPVSQEWIKFQVNEALPTAGFFTERRTISQGLCAANENIEVFARLK